MRDHPPTDTDLDFRNVLDHGIVRLIDHMGSDLSIVRAARVSYDAAWRAGEDTGSDARLINYLAKNQHTTPFEAVAFTFEIKAPIFVFRQWHRHRTWSYNELSARYRELPEEYYVPEAWAITTQHTDNKQMRTMVQHPEAEDIAEMIASSNMIAFDHYQRMIEMGAPRELARSVLPVGTYSHMFATVNLLNCLKFILLRDHDHAQHEIRVYAAALRELIEPIVPEAVKAWTSTSVREAALALYEAGMWETDGLTTDEQAAMWEDLRNALGLKKGHATRLMADA